MTTKAQRLARLDDFTRAYIRVALWTETDDNERPLDDNYDSEHLTNRAIDRIAAECKRFQEQNAPMLARAGDAAQNGHDFWLTRNGHGVGFRDRGYPDDIGEPLTAAARACAPAHLVVNRGRLDYWSEWK